MAGVVGAASSLAAGDRSELGERGDHASGWREAGEPRRVKRRIVAACCRLYRLSAIVGRASPEHRNVNLHVQLTRALECAACRALVLDPHDLPPAEDCLVRCRACGVSFGLYCDFRSRVVRAIAEEIERKDTGTRH